MGAKILDIASGLLVVAGIMVLVRPGSQGPALVSNSTSGFAKLISASTGGGTFN